MELQQYVNDPFERTSTPVFGNSTNAPEDPYYDNFRTKLAAPLTKACIRGVYGPKKGLISGHLAMKPTVPSQRNYTYVMAFPREISRTFNDSCASCASVSGRSMFRQQQFMTNAGRSMHRQQHVMPNALPGYPVYSVHAVHTHQYHMFPNVRHVPHQAPMFCLPVRY